MDGSLEGYNNNSILSGNRYYPVIQKIFEYLPEKDFYTARLVCASWNEVSLPLMKTYEYVINLDLKKESDYEVIQSLTTMFKEQKDVPFLHYDFNSDGLKDFPMVNDYQGTLSNFFIICGPYIRKLIIDILSIKFWNISSPDCFNFPCLEFLEIDQREGTTKKLFDDKEITMKKIAQYFKNITNGAPNLKFLALKELENGEDDESDYILSILNEMREQQPSMRRLNRLEIEVNNQSQLTALVAAAKRLKLEYLEITLDFQCIIDDVKRALDSQKNTLKTLILYFGKEEAFIREPLTFPRMHTLETLMIVYLDKYQNEFNPVQYSKISYVDRFPVLKTLEFYVEEATLDSEKLVDEFLSMSMTPLNTLQKLVLPKCPNIDILNVLPKVSFLFPKLKKISLSTGRPLEDIMNGVRMLHELSELKVFLLYDDHEHKYNVCFPCSIGKKVLKQHADLEEEHWNKQEASHIVKIVEIQLRKLRLESLNHIRFTCTQSENHLSNVELFIQKNHCGDYSAYIQVKQQECENEKYWMEL